MILHFIYKVHWIKNIIVKIQLLYQPIIKFCSITKRTGVKIDSIR